MNSTGLLGRSVEIVAVALLGAALGLIQILIGGTRLIFSLPTYAILAIVGLLTLFFLRQPRPRPAQLCLISSAIFFGYILARAFFSPVDYTARPDIYAVLSGLIVYLFVACIATSAKLRASVLISLLALALVHVLIGAIHSLIEAADHFEVIRWNGLARRVAHSLFAEIRLWPPGERILCLSKSSCRSARSARNFRD